MVPSTAPIAPVVRPTVSPTVMPAVPPVAAPFVAQPVDRPRCGCSSCTQEVLATLAGGHSCGSRIDWVIANMGKSESSACKLVAGEEFPSECGNCNPNICSNPYPTGAPIEDIDPVGSPQIRPSPSPSGVLLSTDKALNAWDVYLGLEFMTHVNSQSPPNYALVAS